MYSLPVLYEVAGRHIIVVCTRLGPVPKLGEYYNSNYEYHCLLYPKE